MRGAGNSILDKIIITQAWVIITCITLEAQNAINGNIENNGTIPSNTTTFGNGFFFMSQFGVQSNSTKNESSDLTSTESPVQSTNVKPKVQTTMPALNKSNETVEGNSVTEVSKQEVISSTSAPDTPEVTTRQTFKSTTTIEMASKTDSKKSTIFKEVSRKSQIASTVSTVKPFLINNSSGLTSVPSSGSTSIPTVESTTISKSTSTSGHTHAVTTRDTRNQTLSTLETNQTKPFAHKTDYINSTDEIYNSTTDPSRLTRTLVDDFQSRDSFWPIALALTIGIPTIVVLAVTITVLYRRRKAKPRSLLSMYGQDYFNN